MLKMQTKTKFLHSLSMKDVSITDMKEFLAIIILMGHVKQKMKLKIN